MVLMRLTMLDFGPNNEFFEGKSDFPQIRTSADERTVLDRGSFHLP